MNNPQFFPDLHSVDGVPFHVHTGNSAPPATPDATKVDKTTTVNGQPLSGNITLAKADIGLGSVDNTADTAKPVSTAQATAINAKLTAVKVVTKAAIATADATDLPTAQALANDLKAQFNDLLAKLKTAGVML